ncbi:MAG TPA: HlyD family type I secretion periplasmic adaptor subunit [Methylomirabilota bacterium]|jgi:HlyD family type I secretion membrane fusion protein|nr:HlyD family type I secretion periplasmic adaptor subunit [Methylomirabilota bacterium]
MSGIEAGPERSGGPPVRGLILAGALIIALFFGGLGAWAARAPLASAALAPGLVAVESNRKTVQHLEGGIISALLVRNGDHVRQGQVLLQLDPVESRAEFEQLEGRRLALLAQRARLIAERDASPDLVLPPELAAREAEPQVAELLAGQRRILAARNELAEGQAAVLEQRIGQYEAEIVSLEAQAASGREQLQLISEELKGVAELFRKGLEKKARLLALQREAARLQGLQGDYAGRVTRARQGIAQTEMEMLSQRQERDAETVSDLRESEVELAEISERLRIAQARLTRTEITAPQDGIVLNLHYFTTGGVVEPGAPILDIVPESEQLVIDAQLDPVNIDEVHPGLTAQLRLTAFKQRITPVLPGRVTQVSADALSDERTGRRYYTARIEIDPEELQRFGAAKLYPGMPVDVMIETGRRTALEYLLTPVSESFARAFREE